ncbi:MAG: chemotaxis-specific protein-glutamate methyltransferase CheB [Polyangiaceae bacterium]|nr:chemotaxis-specific protein-glutamate methyltransferase CheB [Polyangiaceae bacterium]
MRPPLRVLVVDDSAFNRRSITAILSGSAQVEVVGKAADGEEALRLVGLLKPDAITLDLEMPRMDGFTFLRILTSKMPTPVIVVSSYAQKDNVFKALELGAIDFVAKPERIDDAELRSIREELLQKVLLTRNLRVAASPARARLDSHSDLVTAAPTRVIPPRNLVAIASSTGGPTALVELMSRLPRRSQMAILIAQHMPEKFTRTFAERLDRRCPLQVREAEDMMTVGANMAFVCPGRKCMELEAAGSDGFRVRVSDPLPTDRYVPSADRLFFSVARLGRERAVGVVLTGMGDDGARGAREIADHGGVVVAESERTAVVYGMPGSAVRTGAVREILPLLDIATFLGNLGG